MISFDEYVDLLFDKKVSRDVVAITTSGEILRGRVGMIEFDKDSPDGIGVFQVGNTGVANYEVAGILECPIGTPV